MNQRTKLPMPKATARDVAGGRQSGLQRQCACGNHTATGGACEACQKEKPPLNLQRAAANPEPVDSAPPVVYDVLHSPGQPLNAETRTFFEPRFNHDFSQVRVHTAGRADESARALNAFAYTAGRDIVFEAGQYRPDSTEGRRLLAHELAHVVQQRGGTAANRYALLAAASPAEREAENAARLIGDARQPELTERIAPSQIGRAAKPGADQPAAGPVNAPGAAPGPNPAAGAKPQRLRFDIIGADSDVANLKAAGLSRDPDLRVSSLADMITQLEAKAPASSNQCVEYLTIFNHGAPGYQALAGEGGKKVATGGGLPGKLARSGFGLDWLYQTANQAALARLRNVFCCKAKMEWLGCGTAGVTAEGGQRSEKELKESEHRYKEFGDRYRSEQDARAHGANLKGATRGQVMVQSWADATCTTIRAATDFVTIDVDNPKKLYYVSHGGEFLDITPSAAGQCSCDPASGRSKGGWTPGQGIDFGDAKWKADLAKFNQAIKPTAGAANPADITATLLALLGDVASGLTMPAGLTAGPKVEPWVNTTSLDPNWVAYTYDHLVFCFPNDCWKWIGVNRTIIQQTPSYTRTTLNHELQHAYDMNIAAFEYKLINGGPPPAPPAACNPGYKPAASDPYGKYILDFRQFYQSGLKDARHMEIYASSAATSFNRFTPDEKMLWFNAMITTVPPDVLPGAPLPGEALVTGVFQNPLAYEAEMRTKFANQLFTTTSNFIYGDNQGKGKDLKKAKSLLNHFDLVWAIHKSDRAMLSSAIRSEESKP